MLLLKPLLGLELNTRVSLTPDHSLPTENVLVKVVGWGLLAVQGVGGVDGKIFFFSKYVLRRS